ncbi:very short patch repair endonuclease [Dyella mobilis]|uniref:DNA mismatch endonuclease Vsr n=1 Tax=Dyella mobilis TaxID=1849582 RepID=A0ABS2KGA0_9GAMM|nr:very short patch repair endonuclease [Dyella mobilis]MBM7130203.1 DNA mismatch endonuclease Vsr [Dyella mobilis]
MPGRARAKNEIPFKRPVERFGRASSPVLYTTRETSSRMARVRQSGSALELAVRQACWATGMRFTLSNRDLPGAPDLANRSRRWAIFVHGCFWHRHDCALATTPKSNRAYWAEKFARNVARDKAARLALSRLGFRVLTLWGCEVQREDVLRKRIRQFARHIQSPG